VQLTPGQLRNTVGLSVEAYRHWKKVLPPFSGRKGYARCFSLGDVLAASILRRLTDCGGIRVGHLKGVSTEIIRLCNTASWAALEGRVLIVDLLNGTCRIAKDQSDAGNEDVVILCPFDPIMAELRDALRRVQPLSMQRPLPFPPTKVVGGPRMQGRRA
jgi:hypothetical protein